VFLWFVLQGQLLCQHLLSMLLPLLLLLVHANALQVRDPDSRQFLMFYEAVAADGSRSIGLATSADGRSSWRRSPEPILRPSDNAEAWDAGGVGAPCAVAMSEGKWRLYYAGRQQQQGPWEGVGVALGGPGDGGAVLSFKRRTGKKQQAEQQQQQQPGELQ
jgi:hypothetical protein